MEPAGYDMCGLMGYGLGKKGNAISLQQTLIVSDIGIASWGNDRHTRGFSLQVDAYSGEWYLNSEVVPRLVQQLEGEIFC
jgi:hypothetical protein